jgi:hypothetical protein
VLASVSQVWDGANKKWEKASELEAVSVGSKRIAFTGTTPKSVNADKLGEYQRKPATFQDGRAVYDCVDVPSRSIWYAKPYWYVGQTEDVGKAQGWLCCKDDAPCPELTKATWRVSDGQQVRLAAAYDGAAPRESDGVSTSVCSQCWVASRILVA